MEPEVRPGFFYSEYRILLSTSCRCPNTKGEHDTACWWVGATLGLNSLLILLPTCWGDPKEPNWTEHSWLLAPAPSTQRILTHQISNPQMSTGQWPALPFSSYLSLGKVFELLRTICKMRAWNMRLLSSLPGHTWHSLTFQPHAFLRFYLLSY